MDLKRSITERFFLRFHMTLILAGTLATGVFASKALLAAGVANPAVRYPLAVVLAYAAFWLLVRLWLWYMARALALPEDSAAANAGMLQHLAVNAAYAHSAAQQPAVPPALPQDAQRAQRASAMQDGGAVEGIVDVADALVDDGGTSRKTARGSSGSSSSWSSGVGDLLKDSGGDSDAGGIIVAILVVALVGLLAAGGAYLIVQAPVILGDLAVELVLASGAVGLARHNEGRGWFQGVLRSTGWWFAAVLAISLVIGVLMRNNCMEARTLSEFFGPVCGR